MRRALAACVLFGALGSMRWASSSAPAPLHSPAPAWASVPLPPRSQPELVSEVALIPQEPPVAVPAEDTAPALVRGWVHDQGGQPIDGATLTSERPDVEIELSDEDGSFVARGPAGAFDLVARADQYLPERLDSLSLGAGEEVRQVDIVLERGLSVAGRVVSDEAGPLMGSHVTAEAGGYLRSAFTVEDGSFELTGLPPGPVTVSVYDDAAGTDRVETHTGDRSVVLRPRSDGHFQGVVLDEHGGPIEGALVFVDETDPRADAADRDPFGTLPQCVLSGMSFGYSSCGPMPECLSRATTDELGRFDVQVAQGARVTVAATHEGRSASKRASGNGDPVTLTLTSTRFRLRATHADGSPYAGVLSLNSGRPALRAIDSTVTTSEDGVGAAPLWPGVALTLSPPAGVTIDFPDGKPPDLSVDSERSEVIDD